LVVVVAVAVIQGYRIAANEWDAFPMKRLGLPEAVYATTFRCNAGTPPF